MYRTTLGSKKRLPYKYGQTSGDGISHDAQRKTLKLTVGVSSIPFLLQDVSTIYPSSVDSDLGPTSLPSEWTEPTLQEIHPVGTLEGLRRSLPPDRSASVPSTLDCFYKVLAEVPIFCIVKSPTTVAVWELNVLSIWYGTPDSLVRKRLSSLFRLDRKSMNPWVSLTEWLPRPGLVTDPVSDFPPVLPLGPSLETPKSDSRSLPMPSRGPLSFCSGHFSGV